MDLPNVARRDLCSTATVKLLTEKGLQEVYVRGTGCITGNSESAGINRHVVGDERALQERKQQIHPGLESCK